MILSIIRWFAKLCSLFKVDFEKKVAEASASDPLDFDIVNGALSNHFVEGSSN